MKSIIAILFTTASLFAQEFDEFEVRPSLGLQADFNISNTDKLQYDIIDKDDKVIHLRNKKAEHSHSVGLNAHLPFLWNQVLNATAFVLFKKANYAFEAPAGSSLPPQRMDIFQVQVQGGPEVGIPLHSDYEKQTLSKVFVFAHIIFSKVFFEDGHAPLKPTQNMGGAAGIGYRYTKERLSYDVGVRYSRYYWAPEFDKSIDKTASKAHDVDIQYSEITPYVAVKIALY